MTIYKCFIVEKIYYQFIRTLIFKNNFFHISRLAKNGTQYSISDHITYISWKQVISGHLIYFSGKWEPQETALEKAKSKWTIFGDIQGIIERMRKMNKNHQNIVDMELKGITVEYWTYTCIHYLFETALKKNVMFLVTNFTCLCPIQPVAFLKKTMHSISV